MTAGAIDGQWVRQWLNGLATGIPFAELAEDWTDQELLDWFMGLYDRPGSGMYTLRISRINYERP